MGLTIDPEFQAIAPPLKEAEMKLLEESILEKGCLEPILVWYGIIIDGHNRYKICGEHHIPYETQNIEFKNRMEAKLWIIKNQLGRRNLNAFQRCEISLQYEDIIRTEMEKRRREAISVYRSTGEVSGNEDDTREKLAEMAGVSHGTLRYAKAIISNADEELIQEVRNGSKTIYRAYQECLPGTQKKTDTKVSTSIDSVVSAISVLREKVKNLQIGPNEVVEELTSISQMLMKGM